MLFDWLVTGGIVPFNPASSVRGPRFSARRGKTPALDDDQVQQLLDSIDTSKPVGLRDRALIAVMAYDFARVGAVVAMNVEDYHQQGKKWWFRFHEKGGNHELPAHHIAEAAVDAYLEGASVAGDKKAPLFRTARGRTGQLTENRLTENDALRIVKRRARAAGLPLPPATSRFARPASRTSARTAAAAARRRTSHRMRAHHAALRPER